VAAALRQRLFVLLCVVALVVTGVVAYRQLPVEAFPDLTNNQVVIVTEAPGLAAVEVEQRVTYPLETAVMGFPAPSRCGRFQVRLVDRNRDLWDQVPVYFARQLVTERLADARGRIPAGLEPTLGPVATAFGEIYQYLIEGDTADAMTRRRCTIGRSARACARSKASARSTRGRPHQAVSRRRRPPQARQVRPDPAPALSGRGGQQRVVRGGFIEHRSERYTVRGLGLARGSMICGASWSRRNTASRSLWATSPTCASRHAAPRAVTRDGNGESVAGW